MAEHNLTMTICRLVAFLVANVVKDEKEYQEWGLPFIAISVEAQFGKDVGARVLEELNSKFCPLIGHGLSLILEEPELEDYTLVHSAEILLSPILDEIESTDDNFEDSLRTYMDKFFHFVLSSQSDEVYDARTRVIARRMCDALNLTASEFSDLESTHWQAESSTSLTSQSLLENDQEGLLEGSSKAQARKKFYEKFNLDSRRVPRSSILASFRIWRVAFIAAGGGALMALTGALAAPAIMSTVLPLICASTTLGQVSVALNTALSCVGLTSLEIIPGLMSSYGATVAGQKMLNRTAPLKDFALKPLHVEDGDIFDPEDVDRALSASKGGGVSNDTSSAGSIDSVISTPPAAKCGQAVRTTRSRVPNPSTSPIAPTTSTQAHAPVFILVSGHLERGIDARQMWGANGFIQDIVDTATTTLSGIVQGSVPGDGTDSGVTQELTVQSTTSTVVDKHLTPVEITTVTASQATSNNNTHDTIHSTIPIPAALPAHLLNESLTDWESVDPSLTGWWRGHIAHGEEYILQWEPSVLERLHDSLQRIVLDKVFGKLKGMVRGEILKVSCSSVVLFWTLFVLNRK